MVHRRQWTPAGVTYNVEETKVNGISLSGGAAGNYVYTETKYEISVGSSSDFVEETESTHAVKGNSSSQATVYNKIPTQKIGVKKIGDSIKDNTSLNNLDFDNLNNNNEINSDISQNKNEVINNKINDENKENNEITMYNIDNNNNNNMEQTNEEKKILDNLNNIKEGMDNNEIKENEKMV